MRAHCPSPTCEYMEIGRLVEDLEHHNLGASRYGRRRTRPDASHAPHTMQPASRRSLANLDVVSGGDRMFAPTN